MSGLEGNPSATSSVVDGSATSYSVEAGSTGSSAHGSDDPENAGEPVVFQPASRAENTIRGGGNRRVSVTLEQPACFGRQEVESSVLAVCE